MSDSSQRQRGEPPADDPTPGADDPTLGGDAAPGGDDWPWLARAWYRSRLGTAVVAGDVLLAVALTAAASVAVDAPYAGIDGLGPGIVPPFVPLFSLLGALGFVSTALIERFDASVGRLLRYNLRLPAALPLGVGVYLLSDLVLGQGVDDVPLVVGLVFLSGLYVNLAYKRLGALARRLLPSGSGQGEDRSGRGGT
ncbi:MULTISPECIES: hypothetical protein [Halorubrum]|uniref:Uncharacterized protein n=1 Tax=Halorubrum tropicale TaxID=1765655 RepID=A0A0M9ATE9_9EURY|nr:MULTISPECIES: hypothetical protein [Halorubrum]KOX97948.1 hypothetical protein AMR74_03340 [Halorubrum tropicale]TKX42356.1 hypothetical protein EXE50_14285 [Halorubrum sp. ARQ200]TKX48902.1 hypothetical protein EXE49_14850 [Halorubrum sp. ASP121]TKX58045.1 hypothetical protein EXE48_16950 [Halorubrum sp. ASP1]